MSGSSQAAVGKRRVTGVDAARGAALIAMMAIHILPAWNEEFAPTLTWLLFAGRGAALFALLAGISLAFMSGGKHPPRGRKMAAARYGLAVRAALITVIGLFLGYLAVNAQVILVYYGVMFLLALPLLGLRVRTLLVLAAGIAAAAPVLMQATRDWLPDMGGVEPNFSTLVEAPGGVIGQVLLSGTYPALPWMAYVCVGLAIGRLDLAERAVQIRLLVAGVALALATAVLSALILGPIGGRQQLVDATSEWTSAPEEIVGDILIWGPDPVLPTDSWWWLASLAPYSSTPLVLANTIGTSAAFLGVLLLLGGARGRFLWPLALLGKMTLTLYSLHLILLATGLLADQPVPAMILQLVIISAFASIWLRYAAQGPLEKGVAEASKWARNKYLARPGDPRESRTSSINPAAAGTTTEPPAPSSSEPRGVAYPPAPSYPPAPPVPEGRARHRARQRS
ncbi:heparan-alpha-glucosaminide N-acetyltransferase domain-containing protein [Arthrobacter sp. zg-Y238]|uniref:heparan-alpha-glucosaminide N-acetyltransferase domain-containing protein n=1 Tax=Arthrobacter sp. zg-Y238 TaxID=2964614 RepID=UPI0021070F8A|nr:heparan-alpha-glucosaminide N-acetyltransferase domain-containing protein [Arthrobacter sp. zg-Y238]MCQ1954539.1 heparan-alpha-glucosaminide N-acetyltransferase domain-containing protein [Arthrobacter sp. zg-Y238]